ncbi:ABC transporter permease [Glycomyces tenuis]|uniref:ABC transporter permease n=1 Tax=Glycomyces tenuis TaxID=58116 RepID=UPI0003F7F7F8|nr:ABC transporter permease [Glycomyces tenuis]
MTDAPASERRAEPETDDAPLVMRRTGQSERYVLQAAALRRRQLRAAVLHGSARSWRQRQPLWPAALIGAIAVALIVAAIAVAGAFEQQRQQEAEAEASASTVVRPSH